ncbi:MAG: Smr/MutS family protein [Ruminococcus sp.]|nr:Smr/MutS family protein [Ruminococcus sp.]
MYTRHKCKGTTVSEQLSIKQKIDLHGHTAESVRKLLTSRLAQLPNDVSELTVIHGCHGGTTLLETVRRFKHYRIERKIIGLNNGETIFVIKPNSKK